MRYWREGSVSTSISAASASDVVAQNNKIRSIVFIRFSIYKYFLFWENNNTDECMNRNSNHA